MRVRATCTLKNSSVGIISAGTIFEGTKETLPGFVLSELRQNRGSFEILPELRKEKKKQKRTAKPQAKPVTNEQPESEKKTNSSLREKFGKTEK